MGDGINMPSLYMLLRRRFGIPGLADKGAMLGVKDRVIMQYLVICSTYCLPFNNSILLALMVKVETFAIVAPLPSKGFSL